MLPARNIYQNAGSVRLRAPSGVGARLWDRVQRADDDRNAKPSASPSSSRGGHGKTE